ncbi:GNAT family N-acetyltransferase [Rhizobium sp. SSA_523]|uniref:GNAT family N-acetyltransferase n=1 Tax=Rhizobium sp. SSA_523 TaxID=2952477 RepID=UPI002090BC13|nr:GNAT family N-acetyltransferase [Rhizobium sp. SSA_523]MCO5730256.1 GNAT family N-acetyltransferase [Rhizobium sp. SSA_523]WKC25311.1 GNAT family N-acetyltransferase [Rhizobium sp. SSA_523]
MTDPALPRIILETPRLRLRSWLEEDRNLFREINADPKVMEFFPFRRTYAEADLLFERVNAMIREDGLGFYAVEVKDFGEAVGFCGLAPANMPAIFPIDTIEIGWRLATRFWGNGYVTEAAQALLHHGFNQLRLPEIVSFAVAGNVRSTAVMQRIGMVACPERDFDHPRVPDTHPHLKRHVTYVAGGTKARSSAE